MRLNIITRTLDAIDEAEHVVFYGMCGAALGVGVCLAVTLIAFDKIKDKIVN